MNTKQLEIGQKVGMATRSRYPEAKIATIDRKTPSGQVLVNGIRFSNRGYQIGDDTYYLVSIEEAEEIIEKNSLLKKKIQDKKEAFDLSPEGISKKATAAAIEILNQHGYYPDVDGDWWGMMGNVEAMIAEYLKLEQSKQDKTQVIEDVK